MKMRMLWLVAVFTALWSCATVPPELSVATARVYYISPMNGDGIQDVLSVPYTLTPAQRSVIAGYEVIVVDSGGIEIATFGDQATSQGFSRRLNRQASRAGVETPETVIWDGRSSSGAFVPDGEYSVTVAAWDRWDNRAEAGPVRVVVDNTPPRVELTIPYRIFSPNEDGSKDFIDIGQTGTVEDLWTAEITDAAGVTMASYRWPGALPPSLIWAGTDESQAALHDGMYRYTVSATDRAANRGSAWITDIGINTAKTPVSIGLLRRAFSPNGDGVADDLTISPVFIADGLDFWTIRIEDANGSVVLKRTGTTATDVVWDGTDDKGNPVDDGPYSVSMTAVYQNGNSPSADGAVSVDRVAPFAQVSTDRRAFSPDGDSYGDTVLLMQRSGSFETSWAGEILTASGSVVARREWSLRPYDFRWNGTNTSGAVVPDGVYSYRLSSTDEAGNRFTVTIPELRVDTRVTTVKLSVSPNAFSPNGDSILDFVTIEPVLTPSDGVAGWTARVRDAKGVVVRRIDGSTVAPFRWGGLVDGLHLAVDGQYTIEYEAIYVKGNRPKAATPTIVVDTVRPVVQLDSTYTLFSPDGDGLRDIITIRPTGPSRETEWKANVVDASDTLVFEQSWQDFPRNLVWNGNATSGARVPDGDYSIHYVSTDEAGNTGSALIREVRVDTRPTPVSVSVADVALSPNGDGVKDSMVFRFDALLSEGIEAWELEILDRVGKTVTSFSDSRWVPAYAWNGRSGESVVPDGRYSARLTVSYEKGSKPTDVTGIFVVDTVKPQATITAEYLLFSPDGDGRRDRVLITTSESTAEREWAGSILTAAGTEVRRYIWRNASIASFSWDGRNTAGLIVPDGVYTYRVWTVDDAGNAGGAEVRGLTVDNRATGVGISAGSAGLSPNDDGLHETITFGTRVNLPTGIDKWTLSITNPSSGMVTTATTGTSSVPPAEIRWNGRFTDGSTITEGSYFASLTVEYRKGNRPSERTAAFVVDVTSPRLLLSVAPKPFSPDGDGSDDIVSLLIRASEVSAIEAWSLRVYDPMGAPFASFDGLGALPAAPIRWDGKSASGELVQAASDYAVNLTVTDIFGNRATVTDTIPVDVYVIQQGDRLVMQISSIYFAPFSAQFQPGKEIENSRTLQRVSDVLKKYPRYRINVEGHAVRVYWYDPARGRTEEVEVLGPLSLQRADVVRAALVRLGIPAERMTTFGYGGTEPLVPHSDLDNRWKNRRVQFVLVE